MGAREDAGLRACVAFSAGFARTMSGLAADVGTLPFAGDAVGSELRSIHAETAIPRTKDSVTLTA
jgi:hypothetical protein